MFACVALDLVCRMIYEWLSNVLNWEIENETILKRRSAAVKCKSTELNFDNLMHSCTKSWLQVVTYNWLDNLMVELQPDSDACIYIYFGEKFHLHMWTRVCFDGTNAQWGKLLFVLCTLAKHTAYTQHTRSILNELFRSALNAIINHNCKSTT